MNVFLRHSLTGFHYAGPTCWVNGPGKALDLGTVERAVEAAREEAFGEMEIVAWFGEPDWEWVLPLAPPLATRSKSSPC